MVQKKRVGGGADFCMTEGRDTLRCGKCSGLDTYKFTTVDRSGLVRWGQDHGSKTSKKGKGPSSRDQGQVKRGDGFNLVGR